MICQRATVNSVKGWMIISWLDFLHVTIWGTQTLAFLTLAKIFDQAKEALKIRDIAESLKDEILIDDIPDCQFLNLHDPGFI